MTRLHQSHPIEVALRRQAGLLLQLAMQCPQRQGKLIRHLFPTDILGKVIFQPGHQMIQPRFVVGRPFREAAFTQQDKQLHKENLPSGERMHIRFEAEVFHLSDDLSYLL